MPLFHHRRQLGGAATSPSSSVEQADDSQQATKRNATTSGRRNPRLVTLLSGVLLAANLYYFGVTQPFLALRKTLDRTSSSSSSSTSNEKSSSSVRLSVKDSKKVSSSTTRTNDEDEPGECALWIAQTSLKGVNGYGLFTTRDIAAGESILGAPDGVGVPVIAQGYNEEPKARERELWRNVWGNYWWGRGVPDHVAYEAPSDLYDYQTGFGCLPNHHCILDVLTYKYPNPPYVDGMVDRFSDPSAGAFSYNRGRDFSVARSLAAGSEIFLNYGYCTRGMRGAPDWMNYAHVTEDFEQAAKLMTADEGTHHSLKFDNAGNLILPVNTSVPVSTLLPKTKAEFDKLMTEVIDTNDDDDDDGDDDDDEVETEKEELIRHIALNALDKRTPEWIKANGLCMDNLITKTSTLPLAGLGAFAKRTIRKGEMVTPAPLMQIIDKDSLLLFDNTKHPVSKQLLINYCFGSPTMTMLLCPNTNAVLINHCSLRTKDCGPLGPNAMVRWSTGWDPSSDDWRQMTIDEIAQQPGRGLSFEIVALRDIAPGQEVFIDYGIEWETAWANHVASWQPPPRPPLKPWITAEQANADEQAPILDEFISGNLRKTVEHPYLFTGCQYTASSWDDHEVFHKRVNWVDAPDEAILERFSDKGAAYEPHDDEEYDDDGEVQTRRIYDRHRDQSYWPCTVLLKEQEGDGFYSYTVRIHLAPWSPFLPWHDNGVPRLLTNYSRHLIHYFVKPFQSDQHLPGVFRHPAGIREELLPSQWKNIAVTGGLRAPK